MSRRGWLRCRVCGKRMSWAYDALAWPTCCGESMRGGTVTRESPGPGFWVFVAAVLGVIGLVALGLVSRLSHP